MHAITILTEMIMSLPTPSSPVIQLNPQDNVSVARAVIPAGTVLPGSNVVARNEIPSGHKISIQPIEAGEPVLKYGQVIGTASAAIQPGEHVHLHNLAMQESDVTHNFAADARPTRGDSSRSSGGAYCCGGVAGVWAAVGVVGFGVAGVGVAGFGVAAPH